MTRDQRRIVAALTARGYTDGWAVWKGQQYAVPGMECDGTPDPDVVCWAGGWHVSFHDPVTGWDEDIPQRPEDNGTTYQTLRSIAALPDRSTA